MIALSCGIRIDYNLFESGVVHDERVVEKKLLATDDGEVGKHLTE